jgi:hypothetical protein
MVFSNSEYRLLAANGIDWLAHRPSMALGVELVFNQECENCCVHVLDRGLMSWKASNSFS